MEAKNITNEYNLPSVFEDFLKSNKYSKGGADFSVTTLIDAPQQAILYRAHADKITEDISERLFPLLGSAVHKLLEENASFEHISEERLFLKIGGKTISGQIDLQQITDRNTVILDDFKVTSDWAVMNDKPEWHEQVNSYVHLIEAAKGLKVEQANIIAIVRNWSKRVMQRKGKDYPQAPVVTINIPIWTFKQREAFLKERVALHVEAEKAFQNGDHLPFCSDKERWMKEDAWALMRRGRQSAIKVCATKEEAEQEQGKIKSHQLRVQSYIEHRPAEPTRCVHWCKVAKFCHQLNTEQQTREMLARAGNTEDRD